MKRERFDYRRMVLSGSFVRPKADNQFNAAPDFSVTRQQHGQRRKVSVIKQVIRVPSTNGKGKKIRRILIFDNHPDSLRLVSGSLPHYPYVDLPRPQRIGFWELVIASVLMIAGLVGMFWPLL
jgi:hypothetical protein